MQKCRQQHLQDVPAGVGWLRQEFATFAHFGHPLLSQEASPDQHEGAASGGQEGVPEGGMRAAELDRVRRGEGAEDGVLCAGDEGENQKTSHPVQVLTRHFCGRLRTKRQLFGLI